MVVLDPLKVKITNFPSSCPLEIQVPNFPADESKGFHTITLDQVFYIEQTDFLEVSCNNKHNLISAINAM